MSNDTFWICQISGGAEVQPLCEHLRDLTRAFARFKDARYSNDIDWYGTRFLIRGSIWTLGDLDGPGPVTLRMKDRFISGNIGVSEHRWQGKSRGETRQFYAESLREQFARFEARISKAKLDFDCAAFKSHTESALNSFLVDSA